MLTLSFSASFLFALAQISTANPAAASALAASAPAPVAAKPTDVGTPQDAKERMALGAKVNGLGGLDLPWHLKATYEVMAAGASTPEKGTYEEWHGVGKQYRVALHSATTSVEEYGSEQGEFRVGAQEWPLRPLSDIREMIDTPGAPPDDPGKVALENYEGKFGSGKFPCTAVMLKKSSEPAQDAPSFCFLPTNAVLLLTSNDEKLFQTVYERSSRVHGQYLAHDMQAFVGGISWMTVHIDLLESLAPAALTALTPPSDARAVTPRVFVRHVETGFPATKTAPTYPASAKLLAIEGMVILDGVVDRTGHFIQLVALSGPTQLRQAALDAVRQWTYEPPMLHGQPVETEVQVHVIFRLR